MEEYSYNIVCQGIWNAPQWDRSGEIWYMMTEACSLVRRFLRYYTAHIVVMELVKAVSILFITLCDEFSSSVKIIHYISHGWGFALPASMFDVSEYNVQPHETLSQTIRRLWLSVEIALFLPLPWQQIFFQDGHVKSFPCHVNVIMNHNWV